MERGVDTVWLGVAWVADSVRLEVPMPKAVLNCTLNATQGKYTFDPVSKVLAWDVGKVDPAKLPNIKGIVSMRAHI